MSTRLQVVKGLGTPAAGLAAATGSFLQQPAMTFSAAIVACVFAYTGEIGELWQRGTRRKRAAEAALTYLMNAAFTVPQNHNQTIPPGVAPFRATIFWPAGPPWARRLKPMLRSTYGVEGVTTADSGIAFRKSEPFAGAAWASPGKQFGRDELPSLADCNGDRDAWKAAWVREGVPGTVADNMGAKGKYIEHVRSIRCFGMKVHGFVVVVSLDSVFRHGFEDEYFRQANLESAVGLAKFLLTEVY